MNFIKKLIHPNKFYYSAATLVTTVVGVGIFGIPFSFIKAGFLTGVLFLVGLAAVLLLSNWMYGELVLRTKQKHQLIGYVGKYLGKKAKNIALFSFMFGIYGALLAIIAISGTFWANVFPFFNLSSFSFSMIFFIAASAVVIRGLRTASRVDLVLFAFFVAAILAVSVLGAGSIDFDNYKTVFFKEFWFLPFGVVLFAFAGMSSVPLMREVIKDDGRYLKKAITIGILVPAVLYLIFALVVVGVSGEITTPDAISGLGGFLGAKAVIVGSLLGFFSTFTVFINIAVALKESFQYDFRIKKGHALLMVLAPPFLLFLSGLRNFIEIIGLVGAVAVSIEAIMMVLTYMKAKKKGDREPEYSLNVPAWALYLLIGMFGIGAGYALIFF